MELAFRRGSEIGQSRPIGTAVEVVRGRKGGPGVRGCYRVGDHFRSA